MKDVNNPFEYEAANNLSEEDIINYYIEDYNYSRFIRSTKNIFLIGERGSGKTMTLLYNSFKIQYKSCKKNGIQVDYEKIGVHIPCNTPLFHKKEYNLLDNEHQKYIICEHFLVLSILYSIADTISVSEELIEATESHREEFLGELTYTWDAVFNDKASNFYEAIKQYVNKETIDTQKYINRYDSDAFYAGALSFSSTILPFLNILKRVELLKSSHFMIMIDDAHDMNEYQIKTLNSWISFRDHSVFSFKVATAKIGRPIRTTSTEGVILEGHDYLTVDMEQELQNRESTFAKWAKEIVVKRLQKVNIKIDPEEFFPANKEQMAQLEEYMEKARKLASGKYGDDKKAINDYVYKYHRAMYFRERSDKANKPPYAGFGTIVECSTGIIRNLLDPCYWMFDNVINNSPDNINSIPPSVQNDVITSRSQRLWDDLKDGLDTRIPNCSADQANQIYSLFDKLMILFSQRLKADIAEPRAVVFSISASEDVETKQMEELGALLEISMKAQYMYMRRRSGKEKGTQVTLYVPNRMLFPARGLDVHGQFSHVSIKAGDLCNAAFRNKNIPSFVNESNVKQLELFDQL